MKCKNGRRFDSTHLGAIRVKRHEQVPSLGILLPPTARRNKLVDARAVRSYGVGEFLRLERGVALQLVRKAARTERRRRRGRHRGGRRGGHRRERRSGCRSRCAVAPTKLREHQLFAQRERAR